MKSLSRQTSCFRLLAWLPIQWQIATKPPFQNFQDLLHHVSGARVVACESSLAQENYIDFDLADLAARRDRLSDELVLLKLFIEQAFATLQRRPIPFEALDLLSFKDVLSIREPLLNQGFMQKYDELMSKSLSAVVNPKQRSILMTLEELERCRVSLESTFRDVLEKEVATYLKRKTKQASKSLVSPGISVALGAAGLIPGVGTLSNLLSMAKDTGSLRSALDSFFNIYQVARSADDLNRLKDLQEQRAATLRKRISSIGDDAGLFDFVDLYAGIIRGAARTV